MTTYCSYCDEQAVSEIPANPGAVCLEHALEFWTGLLTYVRAQQSEPSEPLASHATCAVCKELSASRVQTIAAVEAAGPAAQRPVLQLVVPEQVARVPLRLASARRRAPNPR